MNSSVRINVRATFGDAQKQFATLIAELNRLDLSARAAGAGVGALDRRLETSGVAIGAWGKKLQYASSILTYNFTVPIVAAFGLLVSSELKYEKALASLEQVYKRTGSSVTDFRQNAKNTQADLGALDGIVMTLSSHYGVARAEVANMATELGRAGSAGVSLAKDTESALIAQRTYNLTAAEGTAAITTLRASYHLTSDETRAALGVLAVSNESTRGSFDLLVAGMVRAAPVASQLGVPLRNLVAILSTMNQAGFKGGEAGNALSAGLQRLVVITPKAADLLTKLGINAQGAAFQSLNGAQRIELLAQKLKGANGDLVAYAASIIFGVQRSKQFDAVIADLSKTTGSYNSILRDTQDTTKTSGFLMQQLGIQLKNPAVALSVLKQQFLNNSSVIARDLLPVLAGLMSLLTRLSAAFAKLSPPVQQFAVFSLVLLALLGPIGKLVGSFGILIGFAKSAAEKILGYFGILVGGAAAKASEELAIQEEANLAMLAVKQQGYTAANTALANALAIEQGLRAENLALVEAGVLAEGEIMFSQIQAASAVSRAMVAATLAEEEALAAGTAVVLSGAGEAALTGFLPILGIAAVLAAIIGAVYVFRSQFLTAFQNIAEGLGYIVAEIYALLQWINPFARHSPSLVENVDGGTARINAAYANMARSSSTSMGIVARAQQELNAILAKMGLGGGITFNIKKGEAAVTKQGIPENIKAYKDGEAALGVLNKQLAANRAAQEAQTAKVNAAKAAYEGANKSIKDAQDVLKGLESQQKSLADSLKKMGDPAALRSQATAASNMGRALLAAGNPALAAQFGAQADKLLLQANNAQKTKDKLDSLSKQIDAQKDAIDKLTDARDKLLETYNAEKDALAVIKDDYRDLESQIRDITTALQQMAEAATQANAATAAAGKPKPGGGKNPGLPGALGSTLGAGKGGLVNDAGDLNKYLDQLKAQLGNKIGGLFPNPLKGVSDFIGKLKDSFTKGFKEFSTNGFAQAFGFGEDLPGWIQKGLAAGILALGVAFTVMTVMITRWLLGGGLFRLAWTFGRGLVVAIIGGFESLSLGVALASLGKLAVARLGAAFLAIPGLITGALEMVGYALISAAPAWAAGAAEAVGGVLLAIAALPAEAVIALGIALVAIIAALYHWRRPIGDFASKIPGWIWDGLTAAWDAVMDLPGFFASWLSSVVPAVLSAMVDFGSKIPGWLWTGFVQFFKTAFYLAGYIIGFLIGASILLTIAFIKLGVSFVAAIWKGITGIWATTVTLVAHIAGWLIKVLPQVAAHCINFGRALPGHIWAGIVAVWTQVLALPSYIGNFLTKTIPLIAGHLYSFGKAFPGHVASGLKSAFWAVLKFDALIIDGIPGVLAAIGGALLSLGVNIVNGIKHGIASVAGSLLDGLTSGISGAIGGLSKHLGIGSPSKVMAAQIGVPMAQGIAMGFRTQTSATTAAAIGHVNEVMSATQAAMNARAKRLTLPRLTQTIDLKYAGQPLTSLPGGNQTNTGPGGGRAGAGGAQQVINVNMTGGGETTDPHALASALAWKLRMSGAA